jgi:predicted ribosomally synthesized peptide with nif11-like leader
MAAQDAKSFLDAVDQDPELRKKLSGSFQQIVKTAQENGYNISAKDLAQELRMRWGMTNPPDYDSDPDTCFA